MSSSGTVLVVHPSAELFGSDRMLIESVQGLRDAGQRVVVALPATGPLVSPLLATGAEVVVIPMLVLRKSLLHPRQWARLFRDAVQGAAAAWRLLGRQKPHAVYVSTITIPEWPVVARLRGARVVSHVHEAEASGSRVVNALLYSPHLLAHDVVVNSEFSLQTIRAALPPLARHAHVVYNGIVAPADASPPRSDVGDTLRVLYVGRLSPRKGPDVVIDAVRSLPASHVQVELTVLGTAFTGYEWYEEQLRSMARSLPEGVTVSFAGFHENVWPFLEQSDVLIVPSRLDEPFGNTAVEGILASRPVIVSETSGLREAAGGYDSVQFTEPGDSAAISLALLNLHARWDEMSRHTIDDRAEALRRHSPEMYRRAVRDAVLDVGVSH